ncbi:MAG: LysR family transcriptional regulator [Gammaproteobacteria bacterium]|nr:LysR family transcriptional regulator [Gammaproteobacteria bacterium]
MDLNLLKVFAAIYENRSISRASEHLFITQSAVSHSLKRLREQYEDPLFTRDGRQMQPTRLAQQIGPRLLATLSELDAIQSSRLSFDPSKSDQQFVIGAREALESLLLTKLVKNTQGAPNIRMSSVAFQRENMARELERRHIDLIVDVPLATGTDIMQAPLVTDEFCVFGNASHAFIQKPSKENYLAANHIAVSARPSGPTVVDYALQRHSLVRHTAIRCQHYHAACSIAAESNYLVTLPRGFAEQMRDVRGAEIAKLPIPTAPIQLHMYWHKNSDADPANQWLREKALNASQK